MTYKTLPIMLFCALFFSLTACASPREKDIDATNQSTLAPPPSVTLQVPPPHSLEQPEPEPSQEETQQPSLVPDWDPSNSLSFELLPTVGAFELPIYGATGYTTIDLPIWKEIPQQDIMAEVQLLEVKETTLPLPISTTEQVLVDVVPEAAQTEAPPEDSGGDEGEATPSSTDTSPPTDAILPTESEPPVTTEPETPSPLPPIVDPFAGSMAVLAPGTPFTILEERDNWWLVKSDMGTGWISHTYCMINLPDVIPSIVYDATNSYASLYTTSGVALPGITGLALYSGKAHNPRFDEEQFIVPALYATAKKISQAQQNALAQGNSLKIYEAYRPYKAQKLIYQAVSALAKNNQEVEAGVNTPPWKSFWFIASGYSNHQRGYAVDVSLAEVLEVSYLERGGHSFMRVTEHKEYKMPTKIHELSIAAITFTEAIDSYSKNAWKKATPSQGMNEPAFALQEYCTSAGLTPLASEWWHFNDINGWSQIKNNLGVGGFEPNKIRSIEP